MPTPDWRKAASAVLGRVAVFQKHAFGDLELQALRRQPGLGEDRGNLFGKAGVAQLQRRHVDGEPGQFGADGEAAGFQQHPFAELADHAAFFGDGDELRRRQCAMDLVCPADQRLRADDGLAVAGKDRLVGELDAGAAVQRIAQLALDLALAQQKVVHVAGEDLVTAAAVLLGFVKCDVGLAQQVVGIGIGTRRQGNADAGADKDLVVHQFERLLQFLQQPLGNVLGAPDVADIEQDHREFVTAQPRHRVDVANRMLKPGGGLAYELVAGRMAERVVDMLETIEVEVKQRHLAGIA